VNQRGQIEAVRKTNNLLLAFTTLVILSIACAPLVDAAGANDFFGNSLPASGGSEPVGGSAAASPGELVPPGMGGANANDLSGDEKRMQKKYREMLKHCQSLIARGDRMIKDGEARKDEKMAKKGKVLKGIGERQFAEFKANSPLPEDKKLPELPPSKFAE